MTTGRVAIGFNGSLIESAQSPRTRYIPVLLTLIPMKRIVSLLLIASALAVSAFGAKVTFHASIAGANEVPGTPSPAWGVGNMELDPATGAFDLVVNLKNVNETLAASHIHVAVAGVNGGVIVPLGGEMLTVVPPGRIFTESSVV